MDKLSQVRHASLLAGPAALRTTHSGSLWQGIVSKQPVHPMSHLACVLSQRCGIAKLEALPLCERFALCHVEI